MSGMLLFSPLTIRGVELKNRIVVPPMHQYSAVKGFPTDWHLMNAGKFAAGGAGLVVVESTKVERRGCGTVGDLGIWDDAFVEPLKRLVKFIKQQNSVAGIQLGHSGRKARADRPWEGDGPLEANARYRGLGRVVAGGAERDRAQREMAGAEGAGTPARSRTWCRPGATRRGAPMRPASTCWSCTARTAISCISSCRSAPTSAPTNMAVPKPNRMRFITEITEAVRAHWPDDKPLFVRLSVEDNAGWGPEQSARLAKILKPKGVDVIDCSSGGITDRRRSWARKSNTATRCRCRNMSAATPIS